MGVRAKKIRGGGGGTILPNTDRNCPTSFVYAYFKGILLVCALQNQNYPFKTNKPDPIARLTSKNCPTFTIPEQILGGGA